LSRKSLVKRPRLILELLQEKLDSGSHTLSIDAKTLRFYRIADSDSERPLPSAR
uniref:Uncharacterized protein n=1 Tax=Musa acuminata subsp. malaccensis TaxID=214687 RepID=A0A804KMN7_MUSAM